mmetsp:Transcript_39600/g.122222  ORF Transcript_39600/g.122222 Transcript_39600/m.122222 type:complete len:269 (-) Transcript_39600:134-940(-)
MRNARRGQEQLPVAFPQAPPLLLAMPTDPEANRPGRRAAGHRVQRGARVPPHRRAGLARTQGGVLPAPAPPVRCCLLAQARASTTLVFSALESRLRSTLCLITARLLCTAVGTCLVVLRGVCRVCQALLTSQKAEDCRGDAGVPAHSGSRSIARSATRLSSKERAAARIPGCTATVRRLHVVCARSAPVACEEPIDHSRVRAEAASGRAGCGPRGVAGHWGACVDLGPPVKDRGHRAINLTEEQALAAPGAAEADVLLQHEPPKSHCQ